LTNSITNAAAAAAVKSKI